MTTTSLPDAARVAAARRWFRRQGYAAVEANGITVVETATHPHTWDANWLQAGSHADAATVFAALERHFPHGWQVVVVDALTPPAVEAALALAEFRAEVTLIEMAAIAVVSPANAAEVTLERVGQGQWSRMEALIHADLAEGKRTGEHDEAVAAGLLESMRRRLGPCDYWLLVEDGVDAGYRMTAHCPDGMGLIENLFTLPERRGRGLMSNFIAAAADRLLASGCNALFVDAHAHDTPKRLYARLGFTPVAITRTWVREVKE